MKPSNERKRVLFVCTHNSARSQMAEGLVNTLHGDRYMAWSAGTEPSEVNVYAISVMKEIGIDISGQRSKSVEEFLDKELDYVVTVCDRANEACPFFPGGKERTHEGFEDPAAIEGSDEQKTAGFRRVRDVIRAWLEESFRD